MTIILIVFQHCTLLVENIPTYARYLMGVVYNEIVFQFAVYYLRVCVSIHLLKHDSLLKHREHKIK